MSHTRTLNKVCHRIVDVINSERKKLVGQTITVGFECTTIKKVVGFAHVYIGTQNSHFPNTVKTKIEIHHYDGVHIQLRERMKNLCLFPSRLNINGKVLSVDELYYQFRNDGRDVLSALKAVEELYENEDFVVTSLVA